MSDRIESSFVQPLPSRPSLEMQQKLAKELLRAAWSGEAEAVGRLRALHPSAPAADALKLADAQLVIARGYGFESWAAMKQKIESLTGSPVDRFRAALRRGDVGAAASLLRDHGEVRGAVNAPIGPFDSTPLAMVKTNLPFVDLLLHYGAELDRKSRWWAGGFGLLEYDCTPATAAPLIERGATVDIFAAAHLGRLDRVRTLVEADPGLVHARGGDGKTALHCARTVDIARYLLEQGAGLDVRDVDHESTPAQYLVRDAPDVARFLVERGAWFDIFVAVGLRDPALVARSLHDDPEALDHRTWQGKYVVAHDGRRPATPAQIGDRRGDVYRWVFGHNMSAIDAARSLGFDDIVRLLLQQASPAQRLLSAAGGADRAAAEAVVREHPDIVTTLTRDQMRLIVDRAHANDTEAVRVMLDLGFDPHITGHGDVSAIWWAAFQGNAGLVRILLRHDPPIGARDPHYDSTLLGWCLHGSVEGWRSDTGDFATTARLLIEAGEQPDPAQLPVGRDDVDGVLREYFRRQ